ncbi:MAG: hypothetical protein ABSG57_08100 [Candidatus Bathyarchaeia archaeon]
MNEQVAQRDTFTTEPHSYIKRGNNTVRARCIEFIETLAIQQTKELPVDAAKQQFHNIIDHWDRTTMKAYFGIQPHTTTEKIDRDKQYSSGTNSHATITLRRTAKEVKGYLELLGLVHYEKRGQVYFMVLENCQIIPEVVKTSNTVASNDNFSLTSKAIPKNVVVNPMARSMQLGSHIAEEGEREGGRIIIGERNRSSESDLLSTPTKLTPEESAILHAKVQGACAIVNGNTATRRD